MRKPPEGLTGFGEVRSGEGKGGGGPAHGGATPNGVLGSGKAYVPQKLAQKNLEGARVLTGVWIGSGMSRKVALAPDRASSATTRRSDPADDHSARHPRPNPNPGELPHPLRPVLC